MCHPVQQLVKYLNALGGGNKGARKAEKGVLLGAVIHAATERKRSPVIPRVVSRGMFRMAAAASHPHRHGGER